VSKARWFLEQLEPAIGTMPIADIDTQMLLGAPKVTPANRLCEVVPVFWTGC